LAYEYVAVVEASGLGDATVFVLPNWSYVKDQVLPLLSVTLDGM
jgi:hypothetical protein